jgi:RNA polymerase sigma-70 factor (ECF subfamily)
VALAEYGQRQSHALRAYVERRLGVALRRKVEPDDLLQDTLAEAVRALPTTDLGERDLFGWLCQLAEQRIIDAHRRFFATQKRDAGREVSLDPPRGGSETGEAGFLPLLAASLTTPSQAFSRNVREQRLHEALAELPEDQREALRLRYVEDLPSKEIAARIGRTDAATRVLLTRALKRLEKIFQESN